MKAVPVLGCHLAAIETRSATERPGAALADHEAMTDPWAVLEKHWPGSAAVLKARNIEPNFANFWPVTRIDRAKRVLGWQPRDTFERYLQQLGWRRTS